MLTAVLINNQSHQAPHNHGAVVVASKNVVLPDQEQQQRDRDGKLSSSFSTASTSLETVASVEDTGRLGAAGVRFQEETDEVIPIPAPLQEKDDSLLLFYSPSEIRSFQAQDRMIWNQLQQALPEKIGFRYAIDDETRGIEQQLCPQRRRRQKQCRRQILSHAKVFGVAQPERLASLAQRASLYAKDLALQEAVRDHKRANQEDFRTEHQLEL